MKICHYIVILIVSLMPPSTSFAAAGYAITPSEYRMLPKFCKYPELKPNIHAHHYCHGIKFILRANRIFDNKKIKMENLSAAVREFVYMQKHCVPNDPILPSTSLYKAQALEKLGKTQEAIHEFNTAIKLRNNSYPKAYMKLSDFYKKIGMEEEALKTVQTGLKYSNNSKGLKRRLKKLQDETTAEQP